jgi:hypothetical protein
VADGGDHGSAGSWRDDPGWRPISFDQERVRADKIPRKPTPRAELANPPLWASLYHEGRIVVTWWRPFVSTEPRATVVGG